MAVYSQVYDSRHLQADCQEPGSALEPYAVQTSMGCLVCLICVWKLHQASECLAAVDWPGGAGGVCID